jgi:hypothetical protein
MRQQPELLSVPAKLQKHHNIKSIMQQFIYDLFSKTGSISAFKNPEVEMRYKTKPQPV